jgi:hypothetical protein
MPTSEAKNARTIQYVKQQIRKMVGTIPVDDRTSGTISTNLRSLFEDLADRGIINDGVLAEIRTSNDELISIEQILFDGNEKIVPGSIFEDGFVISVVGNECVIVKPPAKRLMIKACVKPLFPIDRLVFQVKVDGRL